MEINGIAHIQLSVAHFERCRAFYRRLLGAMGMTVVTDTSEIFYCVGARTAVALTPCATEFLSERFNQRRVGLHHLCFRARSRADVDEAFALVRELQATIVYPPREGSWAPGYYSVAFEDPDGTRLEINHVPARGVLDLEEPRVDFGNSGAA